MSVQVAKKIRRPALNVFDDGVHSGRLMGLKKIQNTATNADQSRANKLGLSRLKRLSGGSQSTVPAHLDRGIFFIFASRQPHMGRSVQYILLDRPDDADRRRDHDADPPLRRPASAQGLSTIRTRDLSRARVSLKIEANRVRGFAGPTRDRKPSP